MFIKGRKEGKGREGKKGKGKGWEGRKGKKGREAFEGLGSKWRKRISALGTAWCNSFHWQNFKEEEEGDNPPQH